ncbi:MAG: Adenylate cyclase [Rhodanobacteraceae bacterium]|jgi:TolB-like protein/thioredoxin-like negative regulator of GroEL|nr:MAG: Adenylate cyclase [Rhodanobacteraceae bacterium]
MAQWGLWRELKRRNVLRAGVLYVGAVWALAQGISQLTPAIGLPDVATRWFLIGAIIGFPFWIAFAWFYEFTPEGFKHDTGVAADAPVRHSNARKLDFAIIGVLIVAVALLGSGYFIRRNAPATVPAVPAKSIAVLPFENLSADRNNEYFVAGMQDLILTKLADVGGLKVVARTSTAKYASHPDDLKTIGQQLGVATILEGSVQKQGNQVLINVQLIDTRTDSHIWAQSYQRTLDNVFGVEGDVAEKIAGALKTRLSPAETARLATSLSQDNTANDLFLQAEFQTNQGLVNYDTASWKTAIPLYRQAIARDPGFALAYARLSYAESGLAWFGGGGMDVRQLVDDARSDAERAVKLAPGLPAAHLAQGFSAYWSGDYATALDAFAAALALRPNDAGALTGRGYVLRRQGRFDAAIASLQQAIVLDPRNSSLAFDLGDTYMVASRYPDAERWLRRALALDPHNLNARTFLARTIVLDSGDVSRALAVDAGDDAALKLQRVTLLVYQRKYREALALLDTVPDTPDNFNINVIPKTLQQAELYRLMGDMDRARPLYAQALPKIHERIARQQGINQGAEWVNLATAEAGLGHVAQAQAAAAEAQAIIARHHDHIIGAAFVEFSAWLYAQTGRPDLAVPRLAEALATPGIGFTYSPVLLWLDPAWDQIRGDAGFQALLRQYAKYEPPVIPSPAPGTGKAGAHG